MKKILLLGALLFSVLPVNAVNWTELKTDIPNLDLYVDTDSLLSINNDECYYAIKYKAGNKPEKYAYLKSNSATDYVGVIQVNDIDVPYSPNAVFKNPHVFMKPVKQDTILSYAHTYVTYRFKEDSIAQKNNSILRNNNEKPVSRVLSKDTKGYVAETAFQLKENWNPPKLWHNAQAIVLLTIGIDGSLQDYKFVKSTGDEAIDRSIISAVEETAPFYKYPRVISDKDAKTFQFVFDYKLFSKRVY